MFSDAANDALEKEFCIVTPSPLQKVNADWSDLLSFDGICEAVSTKDAFKQMEVWCKRDDLLHPIISGNKWRKLAKPLQDFMHERPKHILSFGGPYSNHLHALAYCCHQLNIKFTAVIRGAYLEKQKLNPTLQDLRDWQCNLVFVDKASYQRRTESDYLAALQKELDVDVIIPEGGSQQDAIYGMQDMLEEIRIAAQDKPFDAILIPVGSGASMAGIVEYCQSNIAKEIIGIASLQGENYLESLVSQFLNKAEGSLNKDTPILPWHINHNFHFGGYAKSTPELESFCKKFNHHQKSLLNKDTPIFVEPVYSGKCFYAAASLIKHGHFPPNSKILIIHTGGLQGLRS
ncbi:MAG: 1-aminocyclopropane-1-carboxylate deaminase [Glaciecola sp.]